MQKPRLIKNYAGDYLTQNGWRIYKSVVDNRWHIVNPETGGDFDSADTLRDLRKIYS